MRKFIFSITLVFIILFSKNSEAKIENNIILKVDNEIITNFEVKNKILSTLIISKEEINQNNIDKIKSKILDELIQLKLKKIELAKYNFKVDQNKLNSYLNKITSNNILELENKFKVNNLDYQLFLEEINTELKWQNLIYQLYSNKIKINESLIDKEIQNIIQNQKKVTEFRIAEIEILLNNDELDKQKILKVQNEIKINGFENTAKVFSISTSAEKKGDLGWVNAKSLSARIYDIVKDMKKESISEPIFFQNSVLFLKLLDKKVLDPKNIDTANLRLNLINQKKNELFNLYSRSHLSKLQNTSFIEYK